MQSRNLILVALILIEGCSGTPGESEAWKKAGEFVQEQEMDMTNGMSWPSTATAPEIVMTPGMAVSARTLPGRIDIHAQMNYERSYTWDGETRTAELWPRKQRWYGSLGLYYPGAGEHWKSNAGITRGVLDEGVLWFKSIEEFLNWVKRTRSSGIDCVYNDGGLLVGFGRFPSRKQVDIQVWQVMVHGRKPESLPGSENQLISTTSTEQ